MQVYHTIPVQLGGPSGPPGEVKDITSTADRETLSVDNEVTVYWTAATDDGSGVAGYSILWDTNPKTEPDTIQDIGPVTSTSTSLPEGGEYWFHIRAVDNEGNWGETVHWGPLLIGETQAGYGNVDGIGTVDLKDAILALQVCLGAPLPNAVNVEADVDGDGRIGMAEAIYVLQEVAGSGF
jgi:hypothetical protein